MAVRGFFLKKIILRNHSVSILECRVTLLTVSNRWLKGREESNSKGSLPFGKKGRECLTSILDQQVPPWQSHIQYLNKLRHTNIHVKPSAIQTSKITLTGYGASQVLWVLLHAHQCTKICFTFPATSLPSGVLPRNKTIKQQNQTWSWCQNRKARTWHERNDV